MEVDNIKSNFIYVSSKEVKKNKYHSFLYLCNFLFVVDVHFY